MYLEREGGGRAEWKLSEISIIKFCVREFSYYSKIILLLLLLFSFFCVQKLFQKFFDEEKKCVYISSNKG